MKRHGRCYIALLLSVIIAVSCTGCMTSVDELYSLPQMSEEYVQLQELIGRRIEEGSAYAAPTGGSNRQSIQLRDLDGDGVAEALAFLVDAARTPTVCVYRQNEESDFYPYVIITGYGSAVASVDYADLNGDGAAELIIAWQGGGDIRLLTVHSLGGGDRNDQQELLSVDCTDFLVCDLDGDGVDDLLDIRIADDRSTMAMYTLTGDGPVASATAPLSDRITGVRRASAGVLSDGTPAVFVESELGREGLVTDVFTAPGGQLGNITMTPLGRSNTLRPDGIFSADMDGDQAPEVPVGSGGDMLTWYNLSPSGAMIPSVSTYYNTDDGWYLVLTGPLTGDVRMERRDADGESSVMFTVMGDGSTPQGNVLIIYTLTGGNRLERAESEGLFVLLQEDRAVYAAQLLTDALTQQDIIDNFHLIYAEWQSGDL